MEELRVDAVYGIRRPELKGYRQYNVTAAAAATLSDSAL
jgi:hypothetical protein